MFRLLLIALLAIALSACAATRYSPGTTSELIQGKRYFDDGYYKSAMRTLLPLACDGNDEAQYAVGYMYYYGYGVGQDSDVGAFWISRSAAQHYEPAEQAMSMIVKEKASARA